MLAGPAAPGRHRQRSDGQLDLLDQGNAALATLAATVSQSGTPYGDAITDLKSMLGTWQGDNAEFQALIDKLPLRRRHQPIHQLRRIRQPVPSNFTLKIAGHEANIFGHRHSRCACDVDARGPVHRPHRWRGIVTLSSPAEERGLAPRRHAGATGALFAVCGMILLLAWGDPAMILMWLVKAIDVAVSAVMFLFSKQRRHNLSAPMALASSGRSP